ncbi:hypothetical protein [Legionella brunensis]|uniref:Uncharacterized protein n=1 Tax=Legionella brunensis TaxID=29422 RepID=A0A0W0SLI8_9GAMM|nr:hypothetical protein [Legionella brunensis]KTC84089.1 hypothetical protein Lbru_1450 [Legionella brunensis]
MKLKFSCNQNGVEISFLLTDAPLSVNRNDYNGSIEDKDDLSIQTWSDEKGVKILSVQAAFYNAEPQSIAKLLLEAYEKKEMPNEFEALIHEDEIGLLLNNQKLLELEEKIYKKYPLLLKKVQELEKTIAKITEKDFTLDYSIPEARILIERRDNLKGEIIAFQKDITAIANGISEHPQLITDIISASNQQIGNLNQYTEENLDANISKKNAWMEQSIIQEIESLRGTLLSAEEVGSRNKKDTLAKFRFLKDLPEVVTDSQKKWLLNLDKEVVEIKTKQLKDLYSLGLLTKTTQEQILDYKPITDKSCDARLNTTYTFFTQDAKSKASREFWTLCCNAVEENIGTQIKQNEPLEKVLKYAALIRGKIAGIRHESEETRFGTPRTEVINQDGYSNDNSILESVIANAAFVSLSDALILQKKLDGNPKELCLKSPVILGNGEKIYLPEEKLTLIYDSNNLLAAVKTEFQPPASAVTPRAEALRSWQNYYLHNKNLSPEELLEGVGKLAFMLSRYYSFERGTGGTTQWIVRGIVQQAFGIDLKDITLGAPQDEPKNGAPYDVYSHVCDDADFYAKQFCKKVGEVQYSANYVENLQTEYKVSNI